MATATGPGSPAAVKAADRVAAAGELLAVIGPAGPGRTSLLLALGGRMRLRGTATTPGARRRVAVARASGATAPDPYDRVGDLLDLAGVHASGRTRAHAVGTALAAVGLSVADHPAAGVPGMLARGVRYTHLCPADQLLLTVALALVGAPDVMLVDAVDDGQDEAGSHRVWTELRRVADAGTTVIAASSSATTAGTLAHRTVLLPHAAPGEDSHGPGHGAEPHAAELQGTQYHGDEHQAAERQGAERQAGERRGAERQGTESHAAELQGTQHRGAERHG